MQSCISQKYSLSLIFSWFFLKKLACLFCHFKCILDEPHNSLVEAISTWRFLHHFSLIASRRSGNCHVLGLEQWLSPNETSPIKRSPIHLRVFDRDHYALENSSLLLHSPLYASLESKSEHYIQPNLFITRNLLNARPLEMSRPLLRITSRD